MGLLAPAGVCQELQCTRAEPTSRPGEDRPADTNLGFPRSRSGRTTGCGVGAGHRCPTQRLLSTRGGGLARAVKQLQSPGVCCQRKGPTEDSWGSPACPWSSAEDCAQHLDLRQQKSSLRKSRPLPKLRFISMSLCRV